VSLLVLMQRYLRLSPDRLDHREAGVETRPLALVVAVAAMLDFSS
jgi:hypothetical protein